MTCRSDTRKFPSHYPHNPKVKQTKFGSVVLLLHLSLHTVSQIKRHDTGARDFIHISLQRSAETKASSHPSRRLAAAFCSLFVCFAGGSRERCHSDAHLIAPYYFLSVPRRGIRTCIDPSLQKSPDGRKSARPSFHAFNPEFQRRLQSLDEKPFPR